MATTIAIDTSCEGIGIDTWPLPEAHPGEPTPSPPPAEVGMAWVLKLLRDLADGTAFEWIYGARKRVTNIDQAMTLVSEEVRVFLGEMVDARYMPSQ